MRYKIFDLNTMERFVIVCFFQIGFSYYSVGQDAFSSPAKQTKKIERIQPNVLFIAIDDMNDWTGFLNGREGMKTPNLDKLVSQGMLFSNAHCSAPSCNPSRASIMTGISPSTSGVYTLSNIWRNSPALADAVTIPEYFKKQGYSVKGGGKIFHALSWIQTGYGLDQNDPDVWDEYFPSKKRSLPQSKWPETSVEDSTGLVKWTALAGPDTKNRPDYYFDFAPLGNNEEMADYKVVDWAINELNQKHINPFFLGIGIFKPHIPWFVPQEYFDMYPMDEVKLPKVKEDDLDDVSSIAKRWVRKGWQDWMLKNDQWKNAVRAYEASISFSDAMIGRLIDGLKKSGNMDNTIIVLWSDHGMHIGEKQHWEKFTLWEESTRVPLAIIAPRVTVKGSSTMEAVSLLDVYPTLVELTGGKVFKQLEGHSLMPLINNPKTHRAIPAVTTHGSNNHSVRTKYWRYTRYKNGDEELYDHQSDPDEFYNVASLPKNRKLIDSLQQWLPKINRRENYWLEKSK